LANGFDDLNIKNQSRNYSLQTWKKDKEVEEFLEVFLFKCLENEELWNSYFNRKNEFFFKCGEPKCDSRLKIVVEDEEEKIEKKEEEEEINFDTNILQENFKLKVPKLTIYRSGKHEKHTSKYQEDVKRRLKCN